MQKSYESTPLAPALPQAFIWRRLHSLTGLFLVLFLFEHLLVNSQAALFIGDDGAGFVSAVNSIKSLPYLPVIELVLLGVPIVLHGFLGIQYLFSSKPNSIQTDGSAPALREYSRNHAYTWQRVTALILVIGLTVHIGYMRFLKRPIEADLGQKNEYMVKLSMDDGLYTLSERLDFQLKECTGNEVMAVTESFGCAELLMVRDAFKSIWICILYTVFVLAACFHAMNGVWNFAIAWGITLTERSRKITRSFSDYIMFLVIFFGLAAIWGTYWINLKS